MPLTDNSNIYCSNISNKLTFLTLKARIENKVNINALNIRAEGFYIEFLGLLFGWQLRNANAAKQNAAGIDLIDEENNIIVQVSSSFDHGKIQRSLNKSDTEEYAGYHFRFVAITEKATNYQPFDIPEGLTFDAKKDVLNTPALLCHVLNAGIDKQKALSALMDKHFGSGEMPSGGQCLTEPPAKADTTSVICRESELQDITQMLLEGKNILLMSGFGGIGKTALARLVFHTVRENYAQVAWLPYRGCLKDSMLSHIRLEEDIRDPEERWHEIQKILNNGTSKLIVIDNADQDDRANQLPHKDGDLHALTGCQNIAVIATSRKNRLPSFTVYPVGFMDEDMCVALFYRYYENPRKAEDEPMVRNLIKLAGCHTFTVELLAKGANCEDSLEKYYQDLKNEGFSFPDIEVETAHNNATTTIAGHLKILFDRKTRSPIQMELLYDFSVLPAAATLSKREIKDWFGIDVNTCEQLVKDGWLFREGGRYAMHPLVKEILHLDPIPENTAKAFLGFVEDYQKNYFQDDEKYTETIRKLSYAETVMRDVCGKKCTKQLGRILDNVGGAYWRVGQYEKAHDHYIKALLMKEKLLGRDDISTAATYNNIARVYQDQGDYPNAREYYKKALTVFELNGEHLSIATALNNIGLVYKDMGDTLNALEHIERAMKIREAELGRDATPTATTYNNIGLIYQDMGKLNDALSFFEKAMKIREEKSGKNHLATAIIYNNIGRVYRKLGQLSQAHNYYKQALSIFCEKLGDTHPSTATTYNNIAGVYKDEGHTTQALEYYEKARFIREEKLGEEHPRTAETYHNMAIIQYELGNHAAAKGLFLRALKIFLIKLEEGHPNIKNTINKLSDCHKAEGNSPETFFPWLMGQFGEEARKILSAHLQEDCE